MQSTKVDRSLECLMPLRAITMSILGVICTCFYVRVLANCRCRVATAACLSALTSCCSSWHRTRVSMRTRSLGPSVSSRPAQHIRPVRQKHVSSASMCCLHRGRRIVSTHLHFRLCAKDNDHSGCFPPSQMAICLLAGAPLWLLSTRTNAGLTA